MIQVITAPSLTKPAYTSVFLAGGITNCRNWQEEVIEELKKDDKDMSVFNPRQKDFNVKDKNASYKQIKWEFERLQAMDIFSMYFCNSDSNQPICLYELGRYVLHMQSKFPSDWEERIVISVEKGYSRSADVRIQLGLCAPNILVDTDNVSPITHAVRILARAKRFKTNKKE